MDISILGWMKYLFLIFPFILVACSTLDDLDANTAEGAFQLAGRYEKAERFEEAIRRYSDVRTKFPYSKWAVEAQLKIADIEYTREYFEEAATAYQIFREMNPRYNKIEYVIYRTAMSFYNQLPEIISRDLSASSEALRYFREYLEKFPTGSWAEDIKKYQQITYKKLANKEMYIGNYYYKQKKFLSALGRYQAVARNYSFLDVSKEAGIKAVRSALKLKYVDVAQEFLDFLKRKFPDSKELQQAKEEGAEFGIL